MGHAEVLLIGGRAGVGKTTVGWEVAARLRAAAVSHAIIEGVRENLTTDQKIARKLSQHHDGY